MKKSKEISVYLLFISIGLSVGFAIKQGWAWYQQPPILIEAETSSHFENTKEKVIVYTTDWCPYCAKVKDYLNENNISFENREVTKADKKLFSLYSSIGYAGIPKIIIGNKIINGAYLDELKQELNKQNLL